MKSFTHAELLLLFPNCPRRDNFFYLADCAVRLLQADPSSIAVPPPWRIEAGIGTLTAYEDGRYEYQAAAPEKEPTPMEMAQRFTDAVARWKAAGYPLASDAELKHRRSACLACTQFFERPAFANGWLGRCKKCGCYGTKLYLATESCPVGVWRSENASR